MTHYDALPIADILREHIRQDQTTQLTVSSDSMSPLLRRGDIVGLRRAGVPQIQNGEIITRSDPDNADGLVTHRAVGTWHDKQGDPLLVTRGDRVLAFDPPAKADEVLGKVVWRSRNGRVLHLDQGRGVWLSAQLGRVSERTRRQVSGVPLADRELTPEYINRANQQALARRTMAGARITRAFGRAWSQVLAVLVIALFRLEKSQPAAE